MLSTWPGQLITAIEASQSISGGFALEEVLGTFLKVMFEYSGAQDGYVLLVRGKEVLLAAEGSSGPEGTMKRVYEKPVSPGPRLAGPILRQVQASLEKVNVHDASTPGPFIMETYLAGRRPKSILCLPLLRNQTLVGLLYLENHLITHAFSAERVALLELLAAQGAISIQNALLHEDLVRQNSERTQENQLRAGQNRVLRLIAMNSPLDETLAELALLIESQTPGLIASILLLEDDGIHVRHGAAPHLPLTYTDAVDGAPIGPCAGSCGTAMYRKRPVIVTDILEDPLWEQYRGLAEEHGLRACWSTPILSHNDDVLGSFAMYYREVRSPTRSDTRLTEIATQLARIAIERKRAEEALKRSEDRYRSFFEEDLAGAFIASPDGTILACNPSFARIFGFPNVPAAIQYNLLNLCADLAAREQLFDLLKKQRSIQGYDLELRRCDGRPVHVLATLIGSFTPAGELTEIKGYVIDHSERKRLENQLRQSQKMEAIGQLASGIAHDFNNLLTAIIGYTELLISDDTVEEWIHGGLKEIRTAAERAAALTGQLLAFSRKQLLQPTVLDLNLIVTEMQKMLRRLIGEHVELHIHLDPQLAQIKADRGQLEQVILNLTLNARDAMPRGGDLTITTANNTIDAFRSAELALPSGKYVRLAVSDTGCGMAADIQSHIFEPFFTTKAVGKGTGLGLSTVYGIVTQSNGYIHVQSKPGLGTSLIIDLPAYEDAPRPVLSSPLRTELPQGTETVLLVEDNEMVRNIARRLLLNCGYPVLEAKDGGEALQLLEERAGAVDLMLTDIVMPGISGIELAEKVLNQYPRIKILFMSGYTDDATVKNDLQSNRAVLAKPFTPLGLMRKIRAVLDGLDEPSA